MCGCGIKKTFSKNPNNVSRNSVVTIFDCKDKYEGLRDMQLKLSELIGSGDNNTFLVKTSRQINSWILNIRRECPPEEELQAISKYIEDEYTKYKA